MPETDRTLGLATQYQPPMSNGEVVFDEPWQGRIFGMAVSLSEAGVFSWSEFQAALIETVGNWDRDPTDTYEYFARFEEALSLLLQRKNLIEAEVLTELAAELAALPHGHDHDH